MGFFLLFQRVCSNNIYPAKCNNISHLEHFPDVFFVSGTQLDIYLGRTNELTHHQSPNQEAAMTNRERVQILSRTLISVAVYLGFISLPMIFFSIA